MAFIKRLWDEYGVFAGILGLVVDTITLAGFAGVHFNWGKSNVSVVTPVAQMPYEEHRLLFILSGAIIVFGFVALCYYIPTLDEYYTEKFSQSWIGSGYYSYDAGIHMVMVSLACVVPAAFLWIRIFFLWPPSSSMFTVIFVASLVVLVLSLLAAFQKVREKVNIVFVGIGTILVIYIVSYGLTDWNLTTALITATVISSTVLLYLKVMTLFPNLKLYSVERPSERYKRKIVS